MVFDQVYTSFQHDESAIPTVEHLGYHNMLWGSDYPHVERHLSRYLEGAPRAVR